MTHEEIVLVDMDGVLADFDSEVIRRLQIHCPAAEILPRKNFYIAEDYPQYKEAAWEISYEVGFFEVLEPIENALDGWQRLLEEGFRPRVCSSPMIPNPCSEQEKRWWLHEKFSPRFGKSVATEAIITIDKHLCAGSFLIDDRPEVRNERMASWRHVVFDQPYNHDSKSQRLKGWLDPNLPTLLSL